MLRAGWQWKSFADASRQRLERTAGYTPNIIIEVDAKKAHQIPKIKYLSTTKKIY